MYLNYFFLTFVIFSLLYLVFRKLNFLVENPFYSSHKTLGSENKSPIIIGGIYILITISIFHSVISINLNIALLLIIYLGLLSDRNILPNPKIRLILQIIILFLIVFIENLSINDLKFEPLNFLLSNKLFSLFFTVFCLAVLLNGSNFLDGLNGLVSGYFLVVILSLIFLKSLNVDTLIIDQKFLYVLFYILLVFLIFNLFGLVYLGDSGSYALALLIGVYLINFNFLNNLISPFYVAVMLWYPAFENLFSLVRRVMVKKNVSNADNYHLHQLVFLFFKSKKIFTKKILNSASSLIIILFNLPSIIISNYYASKSLVLTTILLINIFFYLLVYYILFQNLVKKKYFLK